MDVQNSSIGNDGASYPVNKKSKIHISIHQDLKEDFSTDFDILDQEQSVLVSTKVEPFLMI